MAPKKKRKRTQATVSHYLSGWAEDAAQTSRHLAEVLIDALCALKRLQLDGALAAYPEWNGEGRAMVQLGIPEGSDAAYLTQHPFLPEGTPLMVITGTQELTASMVGFARGVSTRWRKRIVTGLALGPAAMPSVMMVSGGEVVVSEGSVFAERREQLEMAGWKVRALGSAAPF